MAALDAAFARAVEGNGQVVGVVAGPGVGKSRLCHEFAESCRARGVEVFTAHALAHASSVPFLPVLEILRAQFGITESDDAATSRTAIEQTVLDLDSALADSVPLLFDFLGVADPDRPMAAMDPEARQRQLFGALNRLRRARSDRGLFVIVVEDLHWLDPGSEAFLETSSTPPPAPASWWSRPSGPSTAAPWAHRSHYAQLPLHRSAAAPAPSSSPICSAPTPRSTGWPTSYGTHAAGTPSSSRRSSGASSRTAAWRGGRGAYKLARTIDQLSIPATVQAVLAARIDRLPDRDKTLLQMASVIGRQCSGAAGRAGRRPRTTMSCAAPLGTLVDGELVYETAPPEEEYAFKHALTEEVAYRSQLTKHRARTHLAVAGALPELDADKLDERAAIVAHHYEAGGSLLEAARWNTRAAAWAGFSHPVEAARHWRRVRALTDRLDQSPRRRTRHERPTAAPRLPLAARRRQRGGPPSYEEEAAPIFAEARLVGPGDAGLRVLFLMSYAGVENLCARSEVSSGHGRRSPQRRNRRPSPTTIPRIVSTGACSSSAASRSPGRHPGDGGDRRRGPFDRPGMVFVSPYAYCQMHLASSPPTAAVSDEGLAALERAAALAAEEHDFEGEAWAHRHWAIFADWAGGDPDAAATHARMAVQWADKSGGPGPAFTCRKGWPPAMPNGANRLRRSG